MDIPTTLLLFSLLTAESYFTPDLNKSKDLAIVETTFHGSNNTEQYKTLIASLDMNIEFHVRYNHNIKNRELILMAIKNILYLLKSDTFYIIYPSIELFDHNICVLRINQINDNIKGNTKIMRIDIQRYISTIMSLKDKV